MLGDIIKKERISKDITQQELSKILEVSTSTIGMYEQNRRSPDNETLTKLAKYFNVSTDYLLGNSDIKNPHKEDNKELSEDDIITLAAHSIGHLDDLSEDEREKIRLAIKIALMNGKK